MCGRGFVECINYFFFLKCILHNTHLYVVEVLIYPGLRTTLPHKNAGRYNKQYKKYPTTQHTCYNVIRDKRVHGMVKMQHTHTHTHTHEDNIQIRITRDTTQMLQCSKGQKRTWNG